jgi:hypothetical protein
MREERLQILRMIQEGTITAEQGASLLAALGAEQAQGDDGARPGRATTTRWFRIRIIDKANDRVKVNLTLPVGLLDWGLKLAESGVGLNLAAVRDVIQAGAEGKILEVDESESSERVEISVE